MRYALRNQRKLKQAFGEPKLKQIIQSLNSFFSSNKVIMTRNEQGVKYQAFTVPNVFQKDCFFVFYIIEQMYDVYKLAFKEEIG